MNLPRYNFSKQSEPELVKFFKAVSQGKNSSATSDHCKLWKQFLSSDTTIVDKFKSFDKEAIIIIEDDDDDNYVSREKPQNLEDLISLEELQHNITSESEVVIAALQEYLKTEETLPKGIIKHLDSICASSNIQDDALQQFTNNINVQCTYKLWKAITAVPCVEQKHAFMFFIHHILIKKILTMDDKLIKILLSEVCNMYPNEVTSAFLKTVLHFKYTKDFKILNRNLMSLQDDHKNLFLSQFKSKCLKLELHHVEIVTALLFPTVCLESAIKLVELMCNVANVYEYEKSFGKLIFDVVKVLGSNVIQIETQVAQLINSNKTVYQVQAKKLFENHLQNNILE